MKKILIIDDDRSLSGVLKDILDPKEYEILGAVNGAEGLKVVRRHNPDLVILDVVMPGLDGLQVKTELNTSEATASIPVIFLTGKGAVEDKVKGFMLGADDYVTKPFAIEELLARIGAILKRKLHYEKITATDPLTGLQNINTYKREIQRLFQTGKRYHRVFSLAVVDIDDFKSINDTYGHAVGDLVLKKAAEAMRVIFRKPDVPIRYGGDEFVILFPESSLEQAQVAMDRLKKKIEEEPLVDKSSGKHITVTISSGIEAFRQDLVAEDELFQLADKKMYCQKAKKKS